MIEYSFFCNTFVLQKKREVMLNVRLDKETEDKLKRYAESHDLSKTMVVKEALAMYFTKKELAQTPYRLGKDLFGVDGSGESSLSQTYKSKLKSKISAKHTH